MEKMKTEVLPVDMKKGMRNLPLRTRARRFCRVLPSKGKAPQTNTYKTTPKLCKTRTTGNKHRAFKQNLRIPFKCNTHPYIYFRPIVLFSFKQLRCSIGWTATPRLQELSFWKHVTEAEVYQRKEGYRSTIAVEEPEETHLDSNRAGQLLYWIVL